MAGNISDQTTSFSNVSITGNFAASRFTSSATAVFPAVWASDFSGSRATFSSRVSTPILNISGGATLSAGSLDLRTSTVVLSWDTRANSSGMTTGELRLVFAASGMSLVYSSGATTYTIGASAVSAAQA